MCQKGPVLDTKRHGNRAHSMRRNLFEKSTFIELKQGKDKKRKKRAQIKVTAHPKSNETGHRCKKKAHEKLEKFIDDATLQSSWMAESPSL